MTQHYFQGWFFVVGMRSNEVFSKALAEVSDKAVEDDIEVVIQEPKMRKESWTKKIGLHLIARTE